MISEIQRSQGSLALASECLIVSSREPATLSLVHTNDVDSKMWNGPSVQLPNEQELA